MLNRCTYTASGDTRESTRFPGPVYKYKFTALLYIYIYINIRKRNGVRNSEMVAEIKPKVILKPTRIYEYIYIYIPLYVYYNVFYLLGENVTYSIYKTTAGG